MATDNGTPSKKAPAKKAPTTAAKKAPAKKAPTTASKPAAKRKTSRLAAAKKLSPAAPMSKYFNNARTRASKMLNDPEALKKVAADAAQSGAGRSGPFAAVMDDFRTLIRLVVAYARGNYRDIPVDSLALVVGGLIYVVSPLDLIPDFLPGGFIDDAAVVVWIVKSVRDELDSFRAWELGQDEPTE